ncbi:hypothetical protein CB0940_11691 [Cercospora beticola]|uniref:Uncharacterized protein n=1 Tax=Cercospora beticola TaxID=122368 RepID=A0A2G5IE42_CERBT|nr:hypothetical protein CB0940_11691 [Cercospora beticola]PIB02784.1 hypothetical protein CB0940_11691 [Cercospora beticola]WPB04046.1 hypothetical protein RHO25_008690 [Cercospora beticola]
MAPDASYRIGLGGFPPIDAPSPSNGFPHTPHSIQEGMNSFNAAPANQQDDQNEAPPQPAPKVPPLGVNNTNRKLLDFPPVVGSIIQYSNKPLPYRPFPDDVEEIREKLFHLEKDVLLNSQQISDYWPHMSNIWQRDTAPVKRANGVVMEIWHCRNQRRVERRDRGAEGNAVQRRRKKKDDMLTDPHQCKLRIRLQFYSKHVEGMPEPCGIGFLECKCIPEWAYITRTPRTKSAGYRHEHNIRILDEYKRSQAIMFFCKLKVEERYSYAAVLKWLKENYAHRTPQVDCVRKQDICNVAQHWRALNKNVELRQEIPEESDLEKQRKEYLSSVDTTPASQLSKALIEVCKQLPQAIDIIIPFLDKPRPAESRSSPITEGTDIVIPFPGCEVAKQWDVPVSTPTAVAGRPQDQAHAPGQPLLQTQPTPQQAVTPFQETPDQTTAHAVAQQRSAFGYSLARIPDPNRPGNFVHTTTLSTPVALPVTGSDRSPPIPTARGNTTTTGWSRTAATAALATLLPPTTSLLSPALSNALRHDDRNASVSDPQSGAVVLQRPSWAAPTPMPKRPAEVHAETPEAKRKAVDEIAVQLRNELQSAAQ